MTLLRNSFFILVIVAILTGLYLFKSVPLTLVPAQEFTISKGDTILSLQKKLNIPLHPLIFRLYIRLYQKDFVLKAGSYHLENEKSLESLFSETLKNPQSEDIAITILPGWNIFDIDKAFSEQSIIRRGELIEYSRSIPLNIRNDYPFLKNSPSLEWFLIPDTYRILPGSKLEMIIRKILTAFRERIIDKFPFDSNEALYNALIMASIVEREEKDSDNKPLVAWVLKKRMAEHMPIWADATVCYAYALTLSDCTPAFIEEHIAEKSKYNTRNMLGLPPTPITNPSVETFRSVVQSTESPYYYYLHDNNGDIHYGRTLDEHNNNRVKYLGK